MAAAIVLIFLALVVLVSPGFSERPNQKGGETVPKQLALEIIGKDSAPMVLVPVGEFMMGTGDKGHHGEIIDKHHRVYLDGFYIDKYEVTTARYAKFTQEAGQKQPDGWYQVDLARHGDRPVIGMDWYGAAAYCRWAGKRLPTEAEWEKAARGTDERRYPWGNEEPTKNHANFGKTKKFLQVYESVTPVGSFEVDKSPYGAYDLAGNVGEWVADWWGFDYYERSPNRNPNGPASGTTKVVRGGNWSIPSVAASVYVNSVYRGIAFPDVGNDNTGFRCAQDAPK